MDAVVVWAMREGDDDGDESAVVEAGGFRVEVDALPVEEPVWNSLDERAGSDPNSRSRFDCLLDDSAISREARRRTAVARVLKALCNGREVSTRVTRSRVPRSGERATTKG